MEGQFLKMPNGQEGNNFVRKHQDLRQEDYEKIKKDWEDREIRDGGGRTEEYLGEFEMKMSPRQKEILSFVVEKVNELLDRYAISGARASLDLIKLVDDKFFEAIGHPHAHGACIDSVQLAFTRGNDDITNSALADSAFHELMHLFSFQRTVLKGVKSDGYADVGFERFGITISSKDNEEYKYFREINEALTVELGMYLWEKMPENKLFNDDIQKLRDKYGSQDGHTILRTIKNEDGSVEHGSIINYPTELEKTRLTMQYIFKVNKEDFNSIEDVKKLFFEAYFSGKLLPIARLIEKTYGKGAFRDIGNESA